MANITAQEVKELRGITNVGMMECKKALQETGGDMDAAIKILRERGMAMAAKKSSRTAGQGLIASALAADGKTGSLIEVNCETDFVAKNDSFKNFVMDLAKKGLDLDEGQLAESAREIVGAKVAEIGENLVVSRNTRFVLDGSGAVINYIHLGAQVGVLMELSCGRADTPSQGVFKELAKDLCMHVAAMNPQAIGREEIDPAVVEAERNIYRKQVENKPAEIVEKIVSGKLNKFYAQVCMLEQGFVKDPDTSVSKLMADQSKALNDTVTLNRFTRYQVGA